MTDTDPWNGFAVAFANEHVTVLTPVVAPPPVVPATPAPIAPVVPVAAPAPAKTAEEAMIEAAVKAALAAQK